MNRIKGLIWLGVAAVLFSLFPSVSYGQELDNNGPILSLPGILHDEWSADTVPGQWLVSYKSSTTLNKQAPEGNRAFYSDNSHDTELVEVQPAEEEQFIEELLSDPAVALVEPNYIYRAAANLDGASTTQDPLFQQQWGHTAVQAKEAWELMNQMNELDAEEVIVAVLDSGIDTAHPDLQGRYHPGYNVLEDSNNVEDDFGHGTAVSGIISAVFSNSTGITGVVGQYPVRILPIKVLDQFGNGSTYSVIQGIEKAVESGADVINLSLSGNGNSYLLQEAIRNAVDQGIIVVAAAGNHADNTSGYYPAMYPETIAVSATNKTGGFASFSNYGTPIDLAAPGEHILTTAPNENYNFYDGTSLSAPYVSAACALLKLTRPDWNVQEIRTALEQSAQDLGDEGYDVYFGHGLLQINSALSLTGMPEPSPGPQLLKPNPLEQVKGTVDFEVLLPAGGSSLSMTDARGTSISPEGLKIRNSERIATFSLNMEKLVDGLHSWTIQVFSDSGTPVGKGLKFSLLVSNTVATGVPVSVLDPEGKPVHGAKVHLMRQQGKAATVEEPFTTVFNMYTNDQGFAFFPEELLLTNENYMVTVSFTDDRTELEYMAVQEIKAGGIPLTFDFRHSYNVTMSSYGIPPSSDQLAMDHTIYTIVPLIHGQELWDKAVKLETEDNLQGETNLPPGTYSAYAIYKFPEGTLLARKEFDIDADSGGKRSKEVGFELGQSRKIEYSLPDWSNKASVYLNSQIGGLEEPLTLQEEKSIWVDSFSVIPSSIVLTQFTEGSEWEYLLEPKDPLHQIGTNAFEIPDQAVLTHESGLNRRSRLTLRPGEAIDIQYSLTLGNSFSISQILKDGESVYPAIVVLDRKGREILRSELYDSSWTVPANIQRGNYSLYLDTSQLPLSFTTSSLTKLHDIRVKEGTGVTVHVISHDSLYNLICELIVTDPKTGEEVYSDMVFHEQEAMFELSGLAPGKRYLLKVRGLTSDQTPFYTEATMQAGESDSVTIDLASKLSDLRLISFQLEAGQFIDLSRNGVSVTSISAEQGGQFAAWLSKGTYTMTLMQMNNDTPYYFKKNITIKQNTHELNTQPDYTSMLRVDWHPIGDLDSQLGIKEKKHPIFTEYLLFPMNSNKELFISPDDYDFEMLVAEPAGQVNIVHVLHAKPKYIGKKIKFQTDLVYTVRLSAKVSGEQEIKGTVKAYDRFGNQLTGFLQVTQEDWNALISTQTVPITGPYPELEGQHKGNLYHAAFRKLGEQPIHPTLRLWQGERLVTEQKATWDHFILKLPEKLSMGKYNLIWELDGTEVLTAETMVKLNRK